MSIKPCKPTRFIILFEERCGSTFLIDALAQQPGVKAGMELLAEYMGGGHQSQVDFAHEFYTKDLRPNCVAVGFKTKLRDICNTNGFAKIITDLEMKVIRLTRRNKVTGTISALNAKRLEDTYGAWNLEKGMSKLPPFHLNIKDFDDRIKFKKDKVQQLDEFIDTLGKPVLEIAYEDLNDDPESTLKAIADWISIDLKEDILAGVTVKKAMPNKIYECITNYDELSEHLQGTEYKWMLDWDGLKTQHA